MALQKYKLVMQRGPEPGKEFPLELEEVYLGRSKDCDLIINDPEVSRKHTRFIRRTTGAYTLEDLGSTNGTFVNGLRLSGVHTIVPGDTLMFGGNISMVVEAETYDPNATLVSSQRPLAAEIQPPPIRRARPEAVAAPPPQAVVPEEEEKKPSNILLAGCIVLLAVACLVAIGALWYIDANNLWCQLFPFLFPGC